MDSPSVRSASSVHDPLSSSAASLAVSLETPLLYSRPASSSLTSEGSLISSRAASGSSDMPPLSMTVRPAYPPPNTTMPA